VEQLYFNQGVECSTWNINY